MATPTSAPQAPAGYRTLDEGTLGELETRVVLDRCTPLSTQAAAGWGGDRYDIYVQGGEAVAAFSVKGLPALQDGVEDWLRDDADVEEAGEVLTASFSDGRSARFVGTPDGFVLVLGNSEVAVERAFDILATG